MKVLILLAIAFALFLSSSGRERAAGNAHVGAIGGSDGPTAVFITRKGVAGEMEGGRRTPEGNADGGAENGIRGEE